MKNCNRLVSVGILVEDSKAAEEIEHGREVRESQEVVEAQRNKVYQRDGSEQHPVEIMGVY